MIAKRFLLVAAAFYSATAGASAPVEPTLPPPEYPDIADMKTDKRESLKKGEYLIKLGDCYACHSKRDRSKPAFAGGDAIKTPFGDLYAPNITPSVKYGLGNWSLADFKKAMKHGRSKDGRHLYPAFPYMYYQHLKDEDLYDMWTYLQALPPHEEASDAAQLMFPFNIRTLQVFWKLMFFYPYEHELIKEPGKSDQWVRGQYLAEGLAHCQMCHTPINFLGGPKRSLPYNGSQIDGYAVPKIIGDYLKDHDVTEDDLYRVFKYSEHAIGAGKLHALPMLEVNEYSLQAIESDPKLGLDADEDLKAIAHYILSTQSLRDETKVEVEDTLGAQLYNTGCAACHNAGLAGSPKLGDLSQWSERVKQGRDTLVTHAYNGIGAMPAKGALGADASREEIGLAVDYMLSKLEEDDGVSSGPVPARPPKKASREDKKKWYQDNCMTCHGQAGVDQPLTKKGVDQWADYFNNHASLTSLYQSVWDRNDDRCQFNRDDNMTARTINGALSYHIYLVTGNEPDL